MMTTQDRDFIKHMIGLAVYALSSQLSTPEKTLAEYYRLADTSPEQWERFIQKIGPCELQGNQDGTT